MHERAPASAAGRAPSRRPASFITKSRGTVKYMQTSEEDCITALRQAASELGESPTRAEYDQLGITPAGPTIQRRFGSWNDAKRAAGLETYDQGVGPDPTPEPKPSGVELPEDVEWDSLSANQRWYYKNREYDIERREERRQELQSWVREQKVSSDGCERCGEDHPATLEYHHPGEKFKSISMMVRDGHSRERMLDEMARCELLCANCHRKLHDETDTGG